MDWYLCFVPDNYNDEEVNKKIDNTCSWKKNILKTLKMNVTVNMNIMTT